MQLPYRKPGKFSQMKTDPLLTEGKLKELQETLERLKRSKPLAAAEVRRLAEMGDFSENAEYQIAKGRLRGINNRILMVEEQMNRAVIIAPSKQADTVQVGHTVTVENAGRQFTYQILGSSETNPAKGIISHVSPIGAALLGHRVGETISVILTESRVIQYKIVSIQAS